LTTFERADGGRRGPDQNSSVQRDTPEDLGWTLPIQRRSGHVANGLQVLERDSSSSSRRSCRSLYSYPRTGRAMMARE
jgi:hypothetical protein